MVLGGMRFLMSEVPLYTFPLSVFRGSFHLLEDLQLFEPEPFSDEGSTGVPD